MSVIARFSEEVWVGDGWPADVVRCLCFNVGAGVNIHKYSGHDYGSFQRGNAFTLLGYIRMVLAKGVQRLPGAG